MTNVYATTLVGGSVTSTAAAAYAGTYTFEGVKETRRHLNYKKGVDEIKNADYSHCTNINEIALALHYLNPNDEIRTIDPDFLTDEEKETGVADKIIYTTSIPNYLKMPKGVELDGKVISTNTDTDEPYCILLANINDIDKDILKPATEDRHIDTKTVGTPVALIGTTTATVLTGNSFVDSSSAATYDAKTYMDSISDTELEELCTDLEAKTLDEQINETLERENVKKLVK